MIFEKSKASRILISAVVIIACLPHADAAAQTPAQRSLDSQATLFDYALKHANQIKDVNNRNWKLLHIAEKYAEAQQFESALALVDLLSDSWFQSKALTSVAVSLWKAGQTKKSELLLERVRTLKPGRVDSGSPTAGYEILEDLITAYLETFQYAKAIETANAISYEGYRIHEFERILSHYSLGKQGEISENWLNDVIKFGDNLELKNQKDAIKDAFTPNERKYREEELEHSKRRTIRGITFYVALAYARRGDIKKAETLANQVGDEVDETGAWNLASRQTALSVIADTYASIGNAEESFRVANLIDGKVRNGTWLLIAEKFTSQDKRALAQSALERVLKLVETTGDLRQTVVVFANAAFVYKQLGQDEKSEQLLRSVLERAKNHKEDKNEAAQYLAYVAEYAAASGNHRVMSDALEAKKRLGTYDSDSILILGGIGLSAASKKQFEVVDIIISEIVKPTDVDNSLQKVRVLTWIAEGLLEGGEKSRAVVALQQALAFKKANPGKTAPEHFGRLAVAMAKAERIDLLTELADSIKVPDRKYISDALADLGVEFAKRGWTLDANQRKTLDRLKAASKEEAPEPVLFP